MLEDSYQGIALAIPQGPEISCPFRGWDIENDLVVIIC